MGSKYKSSINITIKKNIYDFSPTWKYILFLKFDYKNSINIYLFRLIGLGSDFLELVKTIIKNIKLKKSFSLIKNISYINIVSKKLL